MATKKKAAKSGKPFAGDTYEVQEVEHTTAKGTPKGARWGVVRSADGVVMAKHAEVEAANEQAAALEERAARQSA